MRPGDIVRARRVEAYDTLGKGATCKPFESHIGKVIAFIALGSVASEGELDKCKDSALRAMGWIPENDADALRAALAAIDKVQCGKRKRTNNVRAELNGAVIDVNA